MIGYLIFLFVHRLLPFPFSNCINNFDFIKTKPFYPLQTLTNTIKENYNTYDKIKYLLKHFIYKDGTKSNKLLYLIYYISSIIIIFCEFCTTDKSGITCI